MEDVKELQYLGKVTRRLCVSGKATRNESNNGAEANHGSVKQARISRRCGSLNSPRADENCEAKDGGNSEVPPSPFLCMESSEGSGGRISRVLDLVRVVSGFRRVFTRWAQDAATVWIGADLGQSLLPSAYSTGPFLFLFVLATGK